MAVHPSVRCSASCGDLPHVIRSVLTIIRMDKLQKGTPQEFFSRFAKELARAIAEKRPDSVLVVLDNYLPGQIGD